MPRPEFAITGAEIVTNGQIAAAMRAASSTLGFALVRTQPGLNVLTEVRDLIDFATDPQYVEPVKAVLKHVAASSRALQTIRWGPPEMASPNGRRGDAFAVSSYVPIVARGTVRQTVFLA